MGPDWRWWIGKGARLYTRRPEWGTQGRSSCWRDVDQILTRWMVGGEGRWRWRDGPLFVEVPFDPDAYQAMVEGIR